MDNNNINLDKTKSEIKTLKRQMQKSILNSDTEGAEEIFHALMDKYSQIRQQINNTASISKGVGSETKVIE